MPILKLFTYIYKTYAVKSPLDLEILPVPRQFLEETLGFIRVHYNKTKQITLCCAENLGWECFSLCLVSISFLFLNAVLLMTRLISKF